jgi:hypothetical protein
MARLNSCRVTRRLQNWRRAGRRPAPTRRVGEFARRWAREKQRQKRKSRFLGSQDDTVFECADWRGDSCGGLVRTRKAGRGRSEQPECSPSSKDSGEGAASSAPTSRSRWIRWIYWTVFTERGRRVAWGLCRSRLLRRCGREFENTYWRRRFRRA